jgi:hypothetical protein
VQWLNDDRTDIREVIGVDFCAQNALKPVHLMFQKPFEMYSLTSIQNGFEVEAHVCLKASLQL